MYCSIRGAGISYAMSNWKNRSRIALFLTENNHDLLYFCHTWDLATTPGRHNPTLKIKLNKIGYHDSRTDWFFPSKNSLIHFLKPILSLNHLTCLPKKNIMCVFLNILKGVCHKRDIIWWGFKIKSSLCVFALVVFFQNFCCLVVEKIIYEVLTCFPSPPHRSLSFSDN